MLFLFKSTPENKKRKHSEHFLHHQEPLGSQRADRTYCNAKGLACRGRRRRRWWRRKSRRRRWRRWYAETFPPGQLIAICQPYITILHSDWLIWSNRGFSLEELKSSRATLCTPQTQLIVSSLYSVS